MNKMQDDEIDFFELIQILWDGKWLIIAFTFTAALIGGGFVATKESTYESKVIYSTDTLPPFYDSQKVLSDFQKQFHSKSVFDEWKKNVVTTVFSFEDISETKLIDGFSVSKNVGEQLVTISSIDDDSFILIKTNQLPIVDNFSKYSKYIHGRLKKEYVQRAKEELNIIETRFEDFSTANDYVSTQILAVDRFIVAIEKGGDILKIRSPTQPKKVASNSSLITTLSIVLGGLLGAAYVCTLSAIKKRQEQSANV